MPGDPIVDLLGSLGPIIAASAAILGGLVALTKNIGKIKLLFARGDQTQAIAELRLLADTRLEMIHTLTDQLTNEKAEHAKTRAERDFLRFSSDESERRLNVLIDRIDREFLERHPS